LGGPKTSYRAKASTAQVPVNAHHYALGKRRSALALPCIILL
jgi:hypothetical protein